MPARQRGAALLILLALFATAAAYMLVSSLNKGSVALSLARAEKNRAVMLEAKAALIAYAASETLQGASFQPGRLPCPDLDNSGNNLGVDATCTTPAKRIGRLPYKTLGIAELRDASGEILWYAVSDNFRTGASVINSDTQGTLTILGLSPATQAVAAVFSPGMRLGAQSRGWVGASCSLTTDPCNIPSNYLEGKNSDATADEYVAATENLTDSVIANLFNDELLVITQQDLMSTVEPVVAARIQRDIVLKYIYDPSDTSTSTQWSDAAGPNKSRYYDAWGGFPFAAPFVNPGTVIANSSIFIGQVGTYEGLLPVVDSANVSAAPFNSSDNYRWILGSGSVLDTGGSGSISSFNCVATTTALLRCTINSSGLISQPSFRMSGTVDGVGRSFVQLPRIVDVSTTGGSIIGTRSLSGRLNAAGAGIVMLDATMPFSFGGTTITVTIKNDNLVNSALISPSDGTAGWYTTNEWHKQTYYAVSRGYSGGNTTCNVGNPCLNVSNLPPPNANPTTNTRAILILAGRSLSGATRPNATLSDYLEAKNASTGDYGFEHAMTKTTLVSGAPVAINDRVIVIAP